MHIHAPTLLALALAVTPVAAQRIVYSPAGTDLQEGSDNNTIPFWAVSASYQQIHDQPDMAALNGGGPLLMTALAFRKDGDVSSATQGRNLDVTISCNGTPYTSQTMTTSFATNLGTGATMVLPYTNFNIPSLTNISKPNPAGFTIVFTTPFVYAPTPGNNFVWELRFKNATATAFMAMDAVSGTSVSVLPNEGAGCIATGQSQPASITTKSYNITTGAFRNMMTRAAASAPAAFFIGTMRIPFALPGMCSKLELLPLLSISGGTDSSGAWDFNAALPSLAGLPQVDILGQFAFVDTGLPLGIGVSDMAVIRTPLQGNNMITRMWYGAYNSGNGNETGTTGSLGRSYGLVTGFQIP